MDMHLLRKYDEILNMEEYSRVGGKSDWLAEGDRNTRFLFTLPFRLIEGVILLKASGTVRVSGFLIIILYLTVS